MIFVGLRDQDHPWISPFLFSRITEGVGFYQEFDNVLAYNLVTIPEEACRGALAQTVDWSRFSIVAVAHTVEEGFDPKRPSLRSVLRFADGYISFWICYNHYWHLSYEQLCTIPLPYLQDCFNRDGDAGLKIAVIDTLAANLAERKNLIENFTAYQLEMNDQYRYQLMDGEESWLAPSFEEILAHIGFKDITDTPDGKKALASFGVYANDDRPLSIWFKQFDMSFVFNPSTKRVWSVVGRFQFATGDTSRDVTDEVMQDGIREIRRRRKR